jgi:hypothetical protein
LRSAAATADPRSEIEILKEARAAVASNPTRALALVNEHAASHPKSALAQEREVLRIQSLVGMGKHAEAKALAEAFKRAYPKSAYAQRLDDMVR